MSLPAVAPHVVADAVAALPNRLLAKLDQALEKQPTWSITTSADGATVTIDDQVAVTLTTPVDTADRATCNCLLAPRCLHRAAVLSAAPVLATHPHQAVAAGPDPGTPQTTVTTSTDLPDDAADSSATAEQHAVAAQVHEVAAQLLEHGVAGAGAVLQADLLRAIHQARAIGLPRLATAATRVVELLRAARRGVPGFRLADLAEELREVLIVCHLLTNGVGDQHVARGVSRRGYRPVGDLHLYGLCAEPLCTTTGHLGAVSYLTDDNATIWSLAQARPGDGNSARNAAHANVNFGDATLSHRELGRAGLVAVNAHASTDRRLSHGRAVQAVRTSGRSWHEEPAAALWRQSIPEQAARWLNALDLAPPERPAGHDLAFLDGVLNADQRGLLLTTTHLPGPVVVLAPHDDPVLPYVANLRLLAAHSAGMPVRMIGRFHGPCQVHGLAIAASWLPDRFGGHVDLGIDQLQRADLPGSTTIEPPSADQPQPPLHLLTHHLQRVVAAGRSALISDVDRDARALLDAQLPTAASVLQELRRAGHRRSRDAFGRLNQQESTVLAVAWLTAATYQHAAVMAATAGSWQSSSLDCRQAAVAAASTSS
ncbi:SWIM zinc finger family protein [Verrucosispora sp. WMMD573]|uniref:SWIM zinc finger family protein n=1 Tax=Verrucosispora sp. WMMD573 TaxID=3015149 RepID=UPI00248BD3C9|nr:SWIM zinc finger family protein [Verrucosispora sp. WMMD573]WBB52458.1 SWIM zinc finger family protein [Verrucosispora sp. WMMD573]